MIKYILDRAVSDPGECEVSNPLQKLDAPADGSSTDLPVQAHEQRPPRLDRTPPPDHEEWLAAAAGGRRATRQRLERRRRKK
jgi:hypothetical protein